MASKRDAAPQPHDEPRLNGGGPTATIEPRSPIYNLPELPANELHGIEEFGTQRNWVSFDAQRGKLICRNLGAEYEEFTATILESHVVRVMKDEDGNVFCASSDRLMADTGREGRLCETCEDRGVSCFPRWWIAWEEADSGLVFAHTLSQTGSMNFMRYVNALLKDGAYPSQVFTRLFVEEAKRHKTNTLYRRLQFERLHT